MQIVMLLCPAALQFVLPPHPKGYVCYRAEKPLVIDGSLSDAAWEKARWTDYFIDIQGAHMPKPRYKTRAKMLWDDNYFYIGAELEEPQLFATLTEHDSVIFHDNDFEVFIDPDADNHNYYEIEINALNTEWDLRLVKPYRDGGPALNSWEIPGLKKGVHLNGKLNDPNHKSKGWTVELAFPWKVLAEFANRPAPPQNGDRWSVNFSRVEWQLEVVDGKFQKVKGKPEDNWVWSPQGVIDMHRPEMWGYVQFSTRAKDEFFRDSSWPVRAYLHQIYYAETAFKKQSGKFTANLADLDLKPEFDGKIELTADGFTATARYSRYGTLHIRQDSRFWGTRDW